MKKQILLAISAAFLLTQTACAGRLFVEDESLSDDSAAASAVNDTTEDSAEPTTEPTTEAPTAPPITVDSAFLEGEWVDEHGFLLCYQDGVMREYMMFEEYEIEFADGKPVATDGEEILAEIVAIDENTITVTDETQSVTAVRLESEQGQKYLAAVKKQLAGNWMYGEGAFIGTYTFTDADILLKIDGFEMENEPVPYTWEGARLFLSQTYEFDGESMTIEEYLAVRIDGNCLTMISEGSESVMYREGSPECERITNAAYALEGVWMDPENLENVWELHADGTAKIDGKKRTFTAIYEEFGITMTLDDGTVYEASVYDDELALRSDGETLWLYTEDSEEIKEARKLQQILKENAALFKAYPDSDGWMEYCDYGDIPLLADADYIKKSAKTGTFLVSTPEELASFNYYVNTQPDAQYLTLQLKNDIDLKGYEWAPMGWNGGVNDHPFTCWVDGGGHTIKNLTIRTDDSDVGFIGWETYCYVGDITFENAVIEGGSHVGIVAGQAIGGRYENCHVSGTVEGGSAGSLLGYEASCPMKNCTADVLVNGEKFEFLSWNQKEKSEIVIEDPVEITMDADYTVHRPEVEGYRNLGWHVFYNGEQVLHRNAENELSYRYFSRDPGKYEIYLSAYVSGQYVPISNTVTYTIP